HGGGEQPQRRRRGHHDVLLSTRRGKREPLEGTQGGLWPGAHALRTVHGQRRLLSLGRARLQPLQGLCALGARQGVAPPSSADRALAPISNRRQDRAPRRRRVSESQRPSAGTVRRHPPALLEVGHRAHRIASKKTDSTATTTWWPGPLCPDEAKSSLEPGYSSASPVFVVPTLGGKLTDTEK